MTDNDKYRLFLYDVGLLIKESALEAKAWEQDETGKANRFSRGVVYGHARVIKLLQQEAEAFDIGLDEIRLDDIEPEGDLI